MKASDFLVKLWDLLQTLEPKTFKALFRHTTPLTHLDEASQKDFFDVGTSMKLNIQMDQTPVLQLTLWIAKRDPLGGTDCPFMAFSVIDPYAMSARSYRPVEIGPALDLLEYSVDLCKLVKRFSEMFYEVKITDYPKV